MGPEELKTRKINAKYIPDILSRLQDLSSKLYFCGHKSYLPTVSHRGVITAVSPCERMFERKTYKMKRITNFMTIFAMYFNHLK